MPTKFRDFEFRAPEPLGTFQVRVKVTDSGEFQADCLGTQLANDRFKDLSREIHDMAMASLRLTWELVLIVSPRKPTATSQWPPLGLTPAYRAKGPKGDLWIRCLVGTQIEPIRGSDVSYIYKDPPATGEVFVMTPEVTEIWEAYVRECDALRKASEAAIRAQHNFGETIHNDLDRGVPLLDALRTLVRLPVPKEAILDSKIDPKVAEGLQIVEQLGQGLLNLEAALLNRKATLQNEYGRGTGPSEDWEWCGAIGWVRIEKHPDGDNEHGVRRYGSGQTTGWCYWLNGEPRKDLIASRQYARPLMKAVDAEIKAAAEADLVYPPRGS